MTKVQQVLVIKNSIINDIENALKERGTNIDLNEYDSYGFSVSAWHDYMGEYVRVDVELITPNGIIDFDDDEYSFEDIQVMHLAVMYDTYLAS